MGKLLVPYIMMVPSVRTIIDHRRARGTLGYNRFCYFFQSLAAAHDVDDRISMGLCGGLSDRGGRWTLVVVGLQAHPFSCRACNDSSHGEISKRSRTQK